MRKVDFTRQAAKYLEKLIKRSPEIARLIAAQIEVLRQNPTPVNSRKIVGHACYRARVGSFRVIYEFDSKTLFVTIVEKTRQGLSEAEETLFLSFTPAVPTTPHSPPAPTPPLDSRENFPPTTAPPV